MTRRVKLGLSSPIFEHLTPFHLLWDVDGKLSRVSPKALEFFRLDPGHETAPELQLTHPFTAKIEPGLLPEITHLILHLVNAAVPDQVLRGEMMELEEGGGWLFSGIPAASTAADMRRFGVQIAELPLHLGIGDFILANEAAKVSLSESQRVNDVLSQEVEMHRESKRQLEQMLEELKAMQQVIVRQERLKALGEMVSGIAHDFSNILTPIMAYSDLLQDEEIESDERGEYLTLIATAASDGAALIRRLRNFYKPGIAASRYVQYSLYQVVKDALALAHPRWSSRGGGLRKIEVVQDIGEDLELFGAENEVRQAILNLLLNAGDAIEGTGEIALSTGLEGDHLWVRVSDSGQGMAPDVLARCGESFFSTKGKQGTGLGLSMVYETAARHGGRVDMTSTVGEGTVVTVYLARNPALRPTDGEDGAGLSGAETDDTKILSEQEHRQLGDLEILIVDDDPVIRHALGRVFSRAGYGPMIASNGEEGMVMIDRHRFDLIICDVDMPKVRGDDLVVAARDRQPHAAILLFSGNPDNIHEEARDIVDRVLWKPSEPEFVLYCGQVLVHERRVAESSSTGAS